MATITLPTTFVDNTVPTASQFNGNFNAIANDYNGGITNVNISGSANIAASKIAGTAASLSGDQTFTGTNTFAQNVQTITALTPAGGGTATCDLSLGNFFFITIPSGNITVALSNATTGQAFLIRMTNDASVRTITWFTTIKWTDGTAPTLSGSSKIDTFAFICTGTNTYDGFIVGQAGA